MSNKKIKNRIQKNENNDQTVSKRVSYKENPINSNNVSCKYDKNSKIDSKFWKEQKDFNYNLPNNFLDFNN